MKTISIITGIVGALVPEAMVIGIWLMLFIFSRQWLEIYLKGVSS